MSTQAITATAFSRNLSALLNQVRYQGISLNVMRGKDTVACVSPPLAHAGYPLAQLGELLAGLPRLSAAEADSFAADLATLRQQLTPPAANIWGDA